MGRDVKSDRQKDSLPGPAQVGMSRKLSEQAQGELRVARMLLQPGGYYAAAEHARLATELALKAALWLSESKGVRGHNIAELLQKAEIRVGRAPQKVQEAIDVLRSATAETRYLDAARPIPLHRFQEADAAVCIVAASEVSTWVGEAVKPKSEETH